MKKILVLLALAAAVLLAGCGHFVPIMPGTDPVSADGEETLPDPSAQEEDTFQEQPLMNFIGWTDFAETYYDETPVALFAAVLTACAAALGVVLFLVRRRQQQK